jgi:hypothetical protein
MNSSQRRLISVIGEERSGANSEFESLLVSSVRYDPSIADWGEPKGSRRGQGSLIKKNIPANVYLDDTPSCRCNCEHRLEAVSNSIKLLSLTL